MKPNYTPFKQGKKIYTRKREQNYPAPTDVQLKQDPGCHKVRNYRGSENKILRNNI